MVQRGAHVLDRYARHRLKRTGESPYLVNDSGAESATPQPRLQRVTVVDTVNSTAMEVTVNGSWHASLSATYRPAHQAEVRRHEARRALEQAEQGDSYDVLHAQIVKVRGGVTDVTQWRCHVLHAQIFQVWPGRGVSHLSSRRTTPRPLISLQAWL